MTINIKKISDNEFKIKYNKDTFYCDKDGGGCMPEKYHDTIFEECLINLLNNI